MSIGERFVFPVKAGELKFALEVCRFPRAALFNG